MHEFRFFIKATALAGFVALVVAVVGSVEVAAQTLPDADETRQAEWADRQAHKAGDLHQDVPSGLERAIARINGALVADRAVYLFVGGVMDGGGLALGPGYRTRFGDAGALQVHGAWSWKGYKSVAGRVTLPAFAGARLTPSLSASWIEAPGLTFRGVGSASPQTGRGTVDDRRISAGTGLRVQPWPVLGFGAEVGALALTSTASGITSAARPGVDVTYAQTRVFAAVDTRGSDGYSARGGRYHVDLIDRRGQGRHDFRQVEAEVQQFLPLLRNHWTLALRGVVTTTATRTGHDVPYTLLPSLGGQTLRGYDAWRFRDRARVLVSGEYRWAAGPHLDVAAFMDAGGVAPRLADLTARGVKTTHGVGFIVHTPKAALARFDLARSREGFALHFSVSPTF